MKRSEMLKQLENYFDDSSHISMGRYKKLSEDVLFLIETMGMTPPVNLKKYTATYNSREWEPENE